MALTDAAIRGTKPGRKPFKVCDRDGEFLLVNPGDRSYGAGATRRIHEGRTFIA
jgi:hypothetical protein